MKVKAAAKINLMLDILGTLPDGYHSLFMIMQSVDCCDTVEVNRAETGTGKIVIRTADERVPKDERNIAYKAAQAFFEETGIKNPGIEIAIEKKIPMAAGLAGGSADAAGVLYCLNSIFETDLPLLELASARMCRFRLSAARRFAWTKAALSHRFDRSKIARCFCASRIWAFPRSAPIR